MIINNGNILFIITIYNATFNDKKLNYLFIIFFLLCLMTGSTSGFLSFIIFTPLFIYSITKLELKSFKKNGFMLLTVVLALFIVMYIFNQRIQSAIVGIFELKNHAIGGDISSTISSQSSNIYPILSILEELSDSKFLGFMLGHGGGQSGQINFQMNKTLSD